TLHFLLHCLQMDFFSLPDVFLHKLMKTMTILDRMRFRLACRAFERLVADTHAGYFETAKLGSYERKCSNEGSAPTSHHSSEHTLLMKIGNASVCTFDLTEDGFERCIYLRQRLFNGISIGTLEFTFSSNLTLPMEFIRRISEKWKIESLCFTLRNETELENGGTLMAEFPGCKYDVDLCFLPDTDKLLSLPTLERLISRTSATFHHNKQTIPSESFFKLLAIHKNIDVRHHYVEISFDEFKRAVQYISEDSRNRHVRFRTESSTVVSGLRNHGLTESSKTGDNCAGFVVDIKEDPDEGTRMELRSGKCVISIDRCALTIRDLRPSPYININNGSDWLISPSY
ncbi:hypothetical protein PENTCL1PPCAC_19912, partial [Pristionchus entomophagus]